MLKKINNYHIFILIIIVFILNTVLFKSIDLTFAQFPSPPSAPGEQLTNIVVNPLQENLNLGNKSIVGEGSINIYGNIGIGTIMPNYPLHIETNTELPVTDNTNHAQILLKTTGQSHGEANITLSTETILAAPWQIFVDDWSGNNIPQDALAIWKDDAVMIFRDTGDVGIGIDEPIGTLHLANGPATALYIETEGSMGNNNSAGEIYFRAELENTPEPRNFALIKAINNIGADAAAGRLDFYASGGEGQLTDPVLSLEGYGRVGIGTIDPNKKLHIYDTGNAEIDLQSVGVAGDGNHWGIYHDSDTDNLRFWHEDDRLTITDDGNVGIGVSDPDANLHIGASKNIGDQVNPAFQIGSEDNAYRFGIYTTGEGAYIQNRNGDDGITFVTREANAMTIGDDQNIIMFKDLTVDGRIVADSYMAKYRGSPDEEDPAWFKVAEHHYSGNTGSTSEGYAMFEIFLMGTSDTNADKVGYAKFHVFCKQQFAHNGSWIKFLGHDNMASNIAYKYTADAGDNGNGLYEVWVKSLHKYGRPHVLVTQNTGFKIETWLSNVGYEQPSTNISQASDWLWNI